MVGIKLADRVLAKKKARLDANKKEVADKEVADKNQPPPLAGLNDLDNLIDLVESDDDEEEDEGIGDEEGRPEDVAVSNGDFDDVVAEQDHSMKYKKSLMNARLGNLDLGRMVGGFPHDLIELKPFSFTFRRLNVLRWWRKVGFPSMSRQALLDPKVCHELGKGGALKEEGKRLELLEEAYREGATGLEALGFNGIDVF